MTSKRQLRGLVADLIRQNIRLRNERDDARADALVAQARLEMSHRSVDLVTGFPVEVDPLRQPSETQELAERLRAANSAAAEALAALSSPAVSS